MSRKSHNEQHLTELLKKEFTKRLGHRVATTKNHTADAKSLILKERNAFEHDLQVALSNLDHFLHTDELS